MYMYIYIYMYVYIHIHVNIQLAAQFTMHTDSNPLHRYEFGPPRFFSKTFNFFMVLYSTSQMSRGG